MSRATPVRPFPVARLVEGPSAWGHGLRGHGEGGLDWAPRLPQRHRGLTEGQQALAIGLALWLVILAVLLLALQGLRVAMPDTTPHASEVAGPGGCARTDPKLPTSSEFEGRPARIGAAFTC